MFTGPEIAGIFAELAISHVVWVPDSEIGLWEPAFEAAAFEIDERPLSHGVLARGSADHGDGSGS